jgi:hypothetical protein
MAKKRLRCRLGLHNWTTRGNEGERYLACRDCGSTAEPQAASAAAGE